MRTILIAITLAVLVVVPPTPAHAADDHGKKVAEGGFHALGTGAAVVAFGAASHAHPAALEVRESVMIFGYEGGPSEGRTYLR